MKNIILCGFMGCGKTTVGKALAEKAGLTFADTDELIEEKANMKISEIFEKYGEAYFRDMEYEVCREISRKSDMVVSTGGGAVTFERNVRELKKSGVIVLLDVPVSTLKHRLKDDNTRPLLLRPDKDKAIEELFAKRIPLYEKACDLKTDGDKSPLLISQDILKKINS